jgi:hypothetical protein
MNRIQIRYEVRSILRDDTYPKRDIDRAINRVIQRLNGIGRMRYHQDFSLVTMVTDDYDYTLDADIIAEDLVVYDPPVSPKPATLPVPNILLKIPTLVDAHNLGHFLTSGDVPKVYVIYMNELWVSPIPNSTTNGNTIRIYHYADVPNLTHDLDSPPARFNPRWHANILALGAAVDISGNLKSGEASLRHIDQFNKNWHMMLKQEFWEANTSYQLQRDGRWTESAEWGNVESVF